VELIPLTDADAADLADLFVSIGMTQQRDVAGAAGFIRHINSDKAIGRKLVVDGVLVGGGQLTVQKYPHAVELGFWVRRDRQGRGHGRTIVRRFTELALGGLGYHRVFAKTFSNNTRSIRCLERAGMVREGVLRDVAFKEGAFYDEILYGRLRGDPPVKPA
jgi:RimJ/RimL family protein N-acetyltransferase